MGAIKEFISNHKIQIIIVIICLLLWLIALAYRANASESGIYMEAVQHYSLHSVEFTNNLQLSNYEYISHQPTSWCWCGYGDFCVCVSGGGTCWCACICDMSSFCNCQTRGVTCTCYFGQCGTCEPPPADDGHLQLLREMNALLEAMNNTISEQSNMLNQFNFWKIGSFGLVIALQIAIIIAIVLR